LTNYNTNKLKAQKDSIKKAWDTIESIIKEINKELNKITYDRIDQTDLKKIFMNMYKIYDETDMGQHPIYNIGNINISLILHLLDWLMGRDKVYKGTAYYAGQLVEAP